MRWHTLLMLAGSILGASPLQAAERNDLPSCYDYAKLSQARPAGSGRELVVIVDKTVQLPKDLQTSAYNHALRYLKPGDSVRMYQFSAYLAGNYMTLMYSGQLEGPLEEKARGDIGMDSLRRLDTCLTKQRSFFQKALGIKFVESFAQPGQDIAKSEIFFSLKQIGEDISQRPAEQKVVLLISDMLENSATSSFYSNNQMRGIDPAVEMKKIEQHQLFADLGGARVYVMGAGLVPGTLKNGYRAGTAVQQLEAFWRDYLARSHANLISFGAPSLTIDLE